MNETQLHNPLEIALVRLESQNGEKTMATWIVANLVQGMDGDISDKIYRFIPPLSRILTEFLSSQGSILNQPLTDKMLTTLYSDKQTEFRTYRALSGLLSVRATRLSFPTEYNDYLQLTAQFPPFIQSVLYEYSLGLEANLIPGTQFYPDAYQRALTISFLTKIRECREILLDNNVISLLTRSLWTRYLDSDLQTSLLWKRSLQSLYYLALRCRERRHLFQQDENINGLYWIAGWEKDKQKLINWNDRQMAAEVGSILHLKEIWEIERLLWITQAKKQKPDCFLALLPKELVQVVLKWLILFSPSDEHVSRVRGIYNGYNKTRR